MVDTEPNVEITGVGIEPSQTEKTRQKAADFIRGRSPVDSLRGRLASLVEPRQQFVRNVGDVGDVRIEILSERQEEVPVELMPGVEQEETENRVLLVESDIQGEDLEDSEEVGERDGRFPPVYVSEVLLREVISTLFEDKQNESGGFWVGRKYSNRLITLDGFIPIRVAATRTSIDLAGAGATRQLDEGLEAINTERQGRHLPPLLVLGTAHTHPTDESLGPEQVWQPTPAFSHDLDLVRQMEGLFMIIGQGGRYDRQLSIWRTLGEKAVRQKSLLVTRRDTGNPVPIQMYKENDEYLFNSPVQVEIKEGEV